MSNQTEHRHLRYFLAVAEDLHFRKAAERLYISQPGLSRQIKQMEEDLGVKLFERDNRKVILTNAGAYLKAEVKKNLKSLDHILNHAKLLHDGKDGILKFSYVDSAMQKIIPELLLEFRQNHPNVLFSLKEMDNQRQIDGLLSQDFDIGFVRLERVPRGIAFKPILSETFCLILPKDHSIDESNFESLLQFKNESFILFDPRYSASYYEKVMQIFDESGFAPLVTHSTIHSSSIYKLVENNFGISIVPKSMRLGYNKGVKFIELDKISQRTTLSAVWDKNNINPTLEKFLKYIQ